jgi:hypothetical protein
MITKNLFLVAIAFATATILSCVDTPQETHQNYLLSTTQITENIDDFVGKSVSVRNDVLETINARGLILDKDSIFKGETIIVINISEIPITFSHDKTPEILVTGRVEKLNLNKLNRQYNLNLDSKAYGAYKGRPTIIATSIILSPDPEDLTKQPELYYEKQLAIQGEVDDIKDHGIFELDEEAAFGGEDLVVLQVEPIQLNEEQNVLIYGMLRPFVIAELERDYNLNWKLSTSNKKHIEAQYHLKPVFIADKIRLLK